MFIHATDSLPSYQAALIQPAMVMTADAGDSRTISSASRTNSDWRVAQVPGTEDLCFVRRGSGGWKGVVTVCEGRVSTLGQMQRPTLEPAVLRSTAMNASYAVPPTSLAHSTPSPRAASFAQQVASLILLFLGIGLAVKSGSMMMEGMRKYG